MVSSSTAGGDTQRSSARLHTGKALYDSEAEAARRMRSFMPTAPVQHPAERITGLKKWEGHITAVDEETFTAELHPYSGSTEAIVVAEFGRDVVGDSDADLLRVGATFYCTVRTIYGPGGHPSRTSMVRLRRLGTWTQEGLDRIRDEARRRSEALAQSTE